MVRQTPVSVINFLDRRVELVYIRSTIQQEHEGKGRLPGDTSPCRPPHFDTDCLFANARRG